MQIMQDKPVKSYFNYPLIMKHLMSYYNKAYNDSVVSSVIYLNSPERHTDTYSKASLPMSANQIGLKHKFYKPILLVG